MAREEVTVQPESGARAEVNSEVRPLATMYLDGIPIQVPQNRIAELQARGALMYGPEDLGDLHAELSRLADSSVAAARRFIDAVQRDGEIDTEADAELHVFQQAMNQLYARSQDLINVAFQNFPRTQEEESPQKRTARIMADAEYHGVSLEEMKRRYGMED